ncbi:MucBP domain-containing protein [Enterococcus faecium]|uniref:MucBP domain-containing protein n=1 Tax=Enterococcus TaxID=1350 RepID=UPI0001B6E8C6|nr:MULTISPECIES: MucBP domain-containing protein [Enterococcus]EEV50313.1 cell wall surface adhesion protein [Enterococcus faecium 1,141,733]EGP4955551.1 prolyl oligopeptidase family serine peptidase [Enterococcus faecium]EGP5246644.1 LPXTG cell wall anchor domain-containing protein [Enterococcus faecium]EGP5360973.1 LPXTG cell wall anchor domain-containing protein [Enterococcus faecium]EGP5430285.1 LPXTG cell wall anchor domain-containing protein [Enterococcus faecium]
MNRLRTKQVLKGALVVLFAVSTNVPQWSVYGESIFSESGSREVETTETTDARNETKSSTSQTETSTETTAETSVTSTDQETTATTDNQQTDEATATKTPNDKSSSAKVSDKENGTENDDIGKGENFNGKKYLNYFGKQMTDILNGPVDEINARLIGLVLSELFGKDYGVDKEIIKHLIATYLLYDIAFSKNSVLMSMLGGTDDGTTPTENTGFYPNTKQLHQTVLNKQDGKMMDVYAYYVDQGSDKTVMIHVGFRGNWNNGIVTEEYNDFYKAGYNLLFVDSRATGNSGGDYVTYGQYESDDVLYWINQEVRERPSQKILLYGGSMGAATMMSVLAKDIPVNVKGIIENCGFASIDEQLRFTYSQTVVPALPPAIKNQLDIIGDQEHEDLFMGLLKQYYFDQEMHLDPTAALPTIGMSGSLPKLIIHGTADDVVPVSNAQKLYELAGGYKDLLLVEGAGHGKAQEVDHAAYTKHVTDFLKVVFHDQINVKYVDENNKSLLKDQDEIRLYGAYGENYVTEQKTFEGYELANVEGPTEGVFNETTPTIIYHYKKIPVVPPKKQDPAENADNKGKDEPRDDQSSDDTLPIQMTVKVQKKTDTKKGMLPKTGEKKHSLLIYSGGFLSASTIITWIWRRKRG